MSNVIKEYSSALAKSLIARSRSLSGLKHRQLKGILRELFVTDALDPYLTNQFSIGTGIVVNQRGEQSSQIDIIVYDNNILPPFIQKQNVGVYPVECVLATIEVKSRLTSDELKKAEKKAKHLLETICDQNAMVTPTIMKPPICSLFAFYGYGKKELRDVNAGEPWLSSNIRNLRAICLADRYSWLIVRSKWSMCRPNKTSEEIKRFIAVVIDNIRFLSQMRRINLGSGVQDWLSVYIRRQKEDAS